MLNRYLTLSPTFTAVYYYVHYACIYFLFLLWCTWYATHINIWLSFCHLANFLVAIAIDFSCLIYRNNCEGAIFHWKCFIAGHKCALYLNCRKTNIIHGNLYPAPALDGFWKLWLWRLKITWWALLMDLLYDSNISWREVYDGIAFSKYFWRISKCHPYIIYHSPPNIPTNHINNQQITKQLMKCVNELLTVCTHASWYS